MKAFLLGNPATKAMALFLAVVTWIYLNAQSNDKQPVPAAFVPPEIDLKEFAWVRYKDAEGREIRPDDALTVTASGPKADVRDLRLQQSKCRPTLDMKKLTERQGSVTAPLERRNFNFPETISLVEPLPSITVEYARFVTKKIALATHPVPYEGAPRPGSEVQSVVPVPSTIDAKVPADRLDVDQVFIQRVRVTERGLSFTLQEWSIDTTALEDEGIRVIPLQTFGVRVEIVAKSATRKVRVPLRKLAPPELEPFVTLEDKDVEVGLTGPEQDVQDVAESAFFVYVVVTESLMTTPGLKNVSELGFHILDPKYRGKINVEIMPGIDPKNRQVKINVRERK